MLDLRSIPSRNYFIIFIGFMLLVLITNHPEHRHKSATPTGDEPHYFVMMESLTKDLDLDVKNNYQSIKYGFVPKNQPHIVNLESGAYFPLHRWGVPFLMAIPYLLGGYLLVIFFTALLTIASLFSLYKFAINKYNHGNDNTFVLGLLTFASPAVIYSTQIYPETYAFIMVSFLIYLSNLSLNKLQRILISSIFIFTFATFHEKLIIIAVPLVFVLLLQSHIKKLFYVGLISGSLFLIYIFFIYGFKYLEFYHSAGGSMIGYENILRSILLLLFDQRSGIIWFFPLLLFSSFLLTIQEKHIFFYVAPYLLLILMFQESHAGFVPPGRYLLPLFPFMYLGIAKYLLKNSFGIINYFVYFVAIVILVGYVVMPGIVYPHWTIPNGYLHYIFGIADPGKIPLPQFNTGLAPFVWGTTLEYLKSVAPLSILLLWVYKRLKNEK